MYKFLLILLFAYGLAVTNKDIYDNSYALIIGIDKYENVSNLDYAVKDANSIASLLKSNFNFPPQNIKTLLNDEATYSNVRKSLGAISTSAKENDRVLIFFAGHGQTMDLPDGGEMGYLLPVDGNQDNLFATSILMDDLKKISSMTRAKHMLFLIDACYGGLASTGSRALSSKTPNYIDKITNDKSRQIITAGGRGEKVIEKAEWGHSAFTMNLMRALEDGKADLNDDGYITANELGLFLKEKVTIDSENQQTPQLRRLTSHEGEFVFINNAYINKQEINITPNRPQEASAGIDNNKIPKTTTFQFKNKDTEFKINIPMDIDGEDIQKLYEKIKEDVVLNFGNTQNKDINNGINETIKDNIKKALYEKVKDKIKFNSFQNDSNIKDIDKEIKNESKGYNKIFIFVLIGGVFLFGMLIIRFQRKKTN